MNHTPKKIVSKGEYAKAQGKCVGLSITGLVLMLLTAGSCLIAFTSVVGNSPDRSLRVLVGMIFAALALLLGRMTKDTFEAANNIDPGVPLTRANTGDLPADKSLVRASEQPEVPQQEVLLRPVVEMQDRYEEQLLRASAGE